MCPHIMDWLWERPVGEEDDAAARIREFSDGGGNGSLFKQVSVHCIELHEKHDTVYLN